MITITINGTKYTFKGNELTSPEQQAIIFLKEQDKLKEQF